MTGYIFRIAALSLAIMLGLASHHVSDRIIETAQSAKATASDTLS